MQIKLCYVIVLYNYIEIIVLIFLKLLINHCYMCYCPINPDHMFINMFYFIVSHKINFFASTMCHCGSHISDLLDGELDVYL